MMISLNDILDAQAVFPVHRARFFASRRIELYEALLATQETGMPLYRGLDMLHETYSKGGKHPYNVIAMVLADAKRALTGGSETLASAIRHWLPDNEAIQLASGEKAGRLEECLRGLIVMTQNKSKMMGSVLAELAEPVLLVILSINLLIQISQKIVPIMSRSVDLSQSSGNTYIMYLLATGVQNYGIYLLGLGGLLVCWVLRSLPRRGDTQFRMILEHFPPWSIYKAIQGATFLLNVAIMLRSGIPLYRALELMRQFASPWLKERVEMTMFGLRQGRPLGVALANTEYDFPDKDVLPFIIVLSQQKDYEQALHTLALKWIDRTLKKVKGILTGVRVFLYFAIAYLAFVLFAGMTSMNAVQ